MFWGLRRGADAHDSPRPAHPYTAMATVTVLRSNSAELLSDPAEVMHQTVSEVAQGIIERLFTTGLDLRNVVPAAGSELAAQRLREAIDQLDAVINGIFAAILDHEQASR